jgi:hypothetical protein
VRRHGRRERPIATEKAKLDIPVERRVTYVSERFSDLAARS